MIIYNNEWKYYIMTIFGHALLLRRPCSGFLCLDCSSSHQLSTATKNQLFIKNNKQGLIRSDVWNSQMSIIQAYKEWGFNPFNPEFTTVIFMHYKPRIAVAILNL